MAMAAVASRGVALRSRVPTFALKHSPERRSASSMTKGEIQENGQTTIDCDVLAGLMKGLHDNSYSPRPVILTRHLGKAVISTAFHVVKSIVAADAICAAVESKTGFDTPNISAFIENTTGLEIPNLKQTILDWLDKVEHNNTELASLNREYTADLNGKLSNLQTAGKSLGASIQQDPVLNDHFSKFYSGGLQDYRFEEDELTVLSKAKVVPSGQIDDHTLPFNFKSNIPSGDPIPDSAPQLGVGSNAYALPGKYYEAARNLLETDPNLTPEQRTVVQDFVHAYERLKPEAAEGDSLKDGTSEGRYTYENDYGIAYRYHNPEFINRYQPLLDERESLKPENQPWLIAGSSAAVLLAISEVDAITAHQQKAAQDYLQPAAQSVQSSSSSEAEQTSFRYKAARHELSLLGKLWRKKDKYVGSFGSLGYVKDCFSVKKAIRSDREAIAANAGRVWCDALKNNSLTAALAAAVSRLKAPTASTQIVSNSFESKSCFEIFQEAILQNQSLSVGLRSELAKRLVFGGEQEQGVTTLFEQFQSAGMHGAASGADTTQSMTREDLVNLLLKGGRFASAYELASNANINTSLVQVTPWQRSKARLEAAGNRVLWVLRNISRLLMPLAASLYWIKHKDVSVGLAWTTVCNATKQSITHSAQKAITLKDFARHGLAPNTAAAVAA